MRAFSPTSKELIGALEDVAYEVEQLVATTVLWRRQYIATTQHRDDGEAGVHANLYLECFLLHLRVLLDFFEKNARSTRKGEELDDVLALDYGFEAAPVAIAPELRQRINQEVAHLSYSRVHRRASKDWFPARMAGPMFDRCDAFADHVISSDKVNIPEPVRARFSELQDMIEAIRPGLQT